MKSRSIIISPAGGKIENKDIARPGGKIGISIQKFMDMVEKKENRKEACRQVVQSCPKMIS